MKDKILFLDFDGVLFDTLREVYLVNRAFYLKKSLFDDIDENVYSVFSKYKYLVYNIWMFYYYNPLVFDGCDDIDNNFKKAIQKRNIEQENLFCDKFLQIRHDLVINHYDFWSSLEKPFDFFFGIKEIYQKDLIDIAIVSKKNKISIKQRFDSYNFHLDENSIFAREILDKYPSKGDFMAEFMKDKGYREAVFVDDNINNLKSVEKHNNITPILALWGNTEPKSKKYDFSYDQTEAIKKIKTYCM